MVTVPTAIAVARPYMWRESIPISSAVSGSCAVARIERPVSVRPRNSWSPPSKPTATAKTTIPRTGIESWSVILMLAVVSAPPSMERESGVKISSSRFWMTIASPKVVSSGTSGPARRLRSSKVRWST